MARGTAAAAKDASPEKKLLPLPEPLLRHHAETIIKAMKQWREQKHVPPVLLLAGPAGIGKRHVAYFAAQWLLCERSGFREKDDSQGDMFGGGMSLFGDEPAAPAPADGDPAPCGECPNCQRALNAHWVDFTEIASDSEDKDSETIKIDQFRQLKATLGFGAFDGAFKITLIRDAERMTVQAANSLLKILEEPPPGWVFFLTCTDPSLLLPTLVSRCQILRLRPLGVDTLKELLAADGISPDRREACAQLAQGSWSKAQALAEPEGWDKRKTILRFIDDPGAEVNALVDWAAEDTEHLHMLLDQLEQLTSDLLKKNVSGPTGRYTTAFLMERAERLFRARQEASAPLNRKVLVQDILLPWLGAACKS